MFRAVSRSKKHLSFFAEPAEDYAARGRERDLSSKKKKTMKKKKKKKKRKKKKKKKKKKTQKQKKEA